MMSGYSESHTTGPTPGELHGALTEEMLLRGAFNGDAITLALTDPGTAEVTVTDHYTYCHTNPAYTADRVAARGLALMHKASILFADLTNQINKDAFGGLFLASPRSIKHESILGLALHDRHGVPVGPGSRAEVIAFNFDQGIVMPEEHVVGRALIAHIRNLRET